nr:MAG TPA: hypothetical protein [Caudoviricetes sp.]
MAFCHVFSIAVPKASRRNSFIQIVELSVRKHRRLFDC